MKPSLSKAIGILLTSPKVRLQGTPDPGAIAREREDHIEDPVPPACILGTDLDEPTVRQSGRDPLEQRAAERDVDVEPDVREIDRQPDTLGQLGKSAGYRHVAVRDRSGQTWIVHLLPKQVKAGADTPLGKRASALEGTVVGGARDVATRAPPSPGLAGGECTHQPLERPASRQPEQNGTV